MVRRSLSILLVLSVLLGATFSVAVAQKPQPPKPMGDLSAAPAIDTANLPETIQQASALKESLSKDQQVAVTQVLEKYLPELKEITELLSAAPKAAPGEQPQPVDKGIALRLETMVKNIDAEMAQVLNASQLELFRAGVSPTIGIAQANPQAADPQGVEGYTENCWYCAYYDSNAKYYAYYAYLYAYYNYYYYSSSSYAYYAYYYSYYGYYYSKIALDYSGPTYFSLYYFDNYTTDYPYYAYYYSYQAYYYAYYGYLYSYYAYYYGSGSAYAYYAYLYGYYAYTGGYYAYYYGYYCYANA